MKCGYSDELLPDSFANQQDSHLIGARTTAVNYDSLEASGLVPIPQRLQEKRGGSSDHANGRIVDGHDDKLGQIDDMQVLPEAIRLIV